LWLLDQLDLVGSAYNVPLAMRLVGELDQEALDRSFTELVRRHESLRTRFGILGGAPYQLIEPPGYFELLRIDLSGISDPQFRERRLCEQMLREQAHHFDLSKGPLFRVLILRLDAREHAVLLTIHHIVMDGWSVGVLLQEFSSLYTAYVTQQPSPLPEPSLQYADFAIWQRRWLKGDILEEHTRYWHERLRGAPLQLRIPTDRPRPAIATFQGAELRFVLPMTLCEQLTEFARHEGATLFMVILATFQLLLSRYSGQQDIVVGSPIAGRTQRNTEGLIGFFVNTLILRTDLSGNPNFRQLLARVRDVTLGAYAHQDLPFEKLVMDLRPERNLTRQPIFQVMLALQNYPKDELTLPGLQWSQISYTYVTSKFDLVLHLFEHSDALLGETDGLRCVFEYSTDLFDQETIRRMSVHFRTLLDLVSDNPNILIG